VSSLSRPHRLQVVAATVLPVTSSRGYTTASLHKSLWLIFMLATVFVLGALANPAFAQGSEPQAPRLVRAPAASAYVIGTASTFKAIDTWCVAYVEPEITFWGHIEQLALRYRGHNSIDENDDCSFGYRNSSIDTPHTPEVRGERAHFFVMDASAAPSEEFFAFPVSEDFPAPENKGRDEVRFPPYARDTYWVHPEASDDSSTVYSSVEELPLEPAPRAKGGPVDVVWAMLCRSHLERPDSYPHPSERLEQYRDATELLPPLFDERVGSESDWSAPPCTAEAADEILSTFPGM